MNDTLLEYAYYYYYFKKKHITILRSTKCSQNIKFNDNGLATVHSSIKLVQILILDPVILFPTSSCNARRKEKKMKTFKQRPFDTQLDIVQWFHMSK